MRSCQGFKIYETISSTYHQNDTFLNNLRTPSRTAYFSWFMKFKNLRQNFSSAMNLLPQSTELTLTKMLVMTHLLLSLISINPQRTSSMNPLFSPLLISSSFTQSNLVMLRRTRSANSSLKSSFHSFRLKIKGSTNLINSFYRDWQELKLIKVERQILVSCQLLMTLLIYAKSSVSRNNSLAFYVLVYCKMALSDPYLTYILGSLTRATSYDTNSGDSQICYSVVQVFD